MMIREYPAKVAEEYWNNVPEPGETIWYGDEEHIVLNSSICNNSKLILKTHPKKEVKHYEDPTDFNSLEWDEFSNSFLEKDNNIGFLEKDSLNHD